MIRLMSRMTPMIPIILMIPEAAVLNHLMQSALVFCMRGQYAGNRMGIYQMEWSL